MFLWAQKRQYAFFFPDKSFNLFLEREFAEQPYFVLSFLVGRACIQPSFLHILIHTGDQMVFYMKQIVVL
jgi:hypothetical protein